jgi:GAF domain
MDTSIHAAKAAEGHCGGRRDLEARLSVLESQARIHAAIADLATGCASAKPDHLDATITAALANIGIALDVDRCTAHLPIADAPVFKAAWRWIRSGCRMPAADFDATVRLPWLMSKARSGETVRVATIAEIPDHADRDSLAHLGAQSCVVVPLGNNESRGALVVETTSERRWPDEAIGSLHLIGAVLGQAVARRSEREQLASAANDVKRRRPHPL